MDANPISAVKNALDVKFLLKFLAGFIIVSAIFELLGFNQLLFSPVAFLKGKFGSGS